MTARYTIVTPVPGVGGEPFAVVADDSGAKYVFPAGSEPLFGLDDARLQRLAGMSAIPVNDATTWLGLATSNLGYVLVGDQVEVTDLATATQQATEVLANTQSPAPVTAAAAGPTYDEVAWEVPQTREQLLAFQRDAAYTWSTQYPAVAAGDADDPEAELALAQLMTPPVDPEKPHEWLPMATTETACGFCDQPKEATIHQASADTITPSPDTRSASG